MASNDFAGILVHGWAGPFQDKQAPPVQMGLKARAGLSRLNFPDDIPSLCALGVASDKNTLRADLPCCNAELRR